MHKRTNNTCLISQIWPTSCATSPKCGMGRGNHTWTATRQQSCPLDSAMKRHWHCKARDRGAHRALSGRTGIAKQQLQAKIEVPLKMSSSLPCFISPRSLLLSRAKQAKLPFRAHLWQELRAPISQSKETATVLVCQLPALCSNKWHTHGLVQYYVQRKKNKRPEEHHPRPA